MAITKTTTKSSSQSSGSSNGKSSSSSKLSSSSSSSAAASSSATSAKPSSTKQATSGAQGGSTQNNTPIVEKKTVTPLPQVNVQQQQPMQQGMGPLALEEEELTPGQKVMSAAPWNPNYKGEQTPATQPQGTVTQPQGKAAPKTLDDINQRMEEAMYKDKTPTPEQLEEERKRNKRNAILATIGDGLSAFHKAYSHARGVKPMELENLSDKMYNRLEKIRKEREANDLAYQNARLRAYQIQQQAEANERTRAYQDASLAETKRYHDALIDKAEKDRKAKKETSEAANQLKESIAEKNRAAANQRSAASNATKQSVAATNAATRKEVATMKSGGNSKDKTETTTTYNRRGEAKKKVVKETKSGTTNKTGSLLPKK